jgi:predicted glycoside hydrolase/deacetylase ChbG (UPF0249 family)
MNIVVNADDMGYMESVSKGIIYAYNNGIVSSSTVMMNMPYALKVKKLIKNVNIPLGVHLTLTVGKPLTAAKSLVDDDGNFYRYKAFYSRKVDSKDVYFEFKAQIDKFIEVFNKKPTHLDCHQGCYDAVSVLVKDHPELVANHNTEEIFEATLKLALEYNLPLRRHCNFKWTDAFYGENATVETIIKTIEENKGHDIEFMVHPAICDLELYRKSSYNTFRVKELDSLCRDEIKKYIKDNKIKLVDFTGKEKKL